MKIANGNSNEMSTAIEIELKNGDTPPTIRCISNANRPLNLTWTKSIGSGSLPNGATQRYEFRPGGQTQYLSWSRNLRASDGGVYVCSSSNTLGENTRAQLTLVLRSKPRQVYIV